MPKVSISEAAKLAGISRKHLYEKYINQGAVSVSREEGHKPLIDTSEILRVFGTLHSDKREGDTKTVPERDTLHPKVTQNVTPEIYELRVQVAVLETEKEGSKQLIKEIREQLERERGRLTQVEHKLLSAEGQIYGLLEARTKQQTVIEQRLNELEKKSLLGRVKSLFTSKNS